MKMLRLLRSLMKKTAAQDLAEYGIAISVVASFIIIVTFFLRTNVFFLWFHAMTRIFSAAT